MKKKKRTYNNVEISLKDKGGLSDPDRYGESFRLYLEDIRNYPLINAKREIELADVIRNSKDDKKVDIAKEELVLANLKLVIKIAIKMFHKWRYYSDFDANVMDFISEGNIGLIRAAELFNPVAHDNVKFSTYAVNWIYQRIDRMLKSTRFIRLPIQHYGHLKKLNDLLNNKDTKELTDDELASAVGVEVRQLKLYRKELVSHKVSAIMYHKDGEEFNFIENIPWDGENCDVEVNSINLRDYLLEKLRELTPKDQECLFYRYFSNDNGSLGKIATKMGVSKERIRQRLPGAIRKLRAKIETEMRVNRKAVPIDREKRKRRENA